MDVAIVTGAASNAGLSIARRLVGMGLRVYGLDASFVNCAWKHEEFIHVECDLFRQEKVALAWKEIITRESSIAMLVHAAGAKLEGPLESAHPDDIRRALEARLMGPALLTRYAMSRLIRIRGSVYFINRRGDNAASQMIEGGIAALCNGLYDEVRDTGMKVCQIALEKNLEGEGGDTLHTRLDPDTVALAVESIMRLPEHNSVTRIILRPQATREEPFAAVTTPLLRWGPDEVRLPEPENFPPEPDPIHTPPRQRPADAPPPEYYDDEDYEDEDDELDRMLEESRQHLRKQVDRQRQSERDRQQHQPHPQQGGDGNQGEGGGRKRKRRRGRRRGRGRDRERNPEQSSQQDGNRSEAPTEQRPAQESSEPKSEPTPKPEKPIEKSSEKSEKVSESPAATPDASSPKKAAKKATKKAVKKAAKKATKKVAKKRATKKVAKKETPDSPAE